MERSARRVSFMLLLIGLALAAAPSARAEDEAAPEAGIYVKISLTALGYVRDVEERFSGGLKLLVLYSDGAASKRLAQDVAAAFRDAGRAAKTGQKVTVSGVSVLRFEGLETLRAQQRERGANCVFISTGLGAELEGILKTTRDAGALSITCASDYVRSGAAFGVVVMARKPRIFVNPEAAEAEGVKFTSALLTRAEVVGRSN